MAQARSFRLFVALAAPVLLLGGSAAASGEPGRSAAPQRIVSRNLCADQLVLALADRGQIAGLTVNARDPQMSAEASKARGLRLLGISAEQILVIEPDLVVGLPGDAANGVLRGRNYPTLALANADSLSSIFRSILDTAAAVGHPTRGEAMVARMRHELAAIGRPGRGRVAAYYQRRGFVTGSGTLVDELMRRVGLVNLATKLGKPPLSRMSLEEMVAARPDFLIVESATDQIADQGSEMLHHPALAGIPRISIPQAWTVCGGPAYVLAARTIARQIERSDRRR